MAREHIVTIDSAACIGCGLCVKDCPESYFSVEEGKAAIKGQDCLKCGHCVAVCPKAAVTMTGYSEPPIEFSQKTVLDSQQLLLAIQTRRSIRRFQSREIPEEVIRQIIEAGRFTPTASNAQDVSYLVLNEGKEAVEKAAVRLFRKLLPFASLFYKGAKGMRISDRFFFKEAPVVIFILSKNDVDGGLAASDMALMAESFGLGVLYSGFSAIVANHSGKVRRLMGLKRGDRVVTALVLGYPDVTYHRTAQREDAAVAYEVKR